VAIVASNQGQRALGLAALLGVAAAVVGYYGLSGMAARAAAGASASYRDVVVTTNDLTFGVKLDPSMLRVAHYPKDAVPDGAYSTVDSVVGQTTKVFMGAREPVTAVKMSSRGGGLSMLIRPSMRAVSIEVNQVSGVSGFVLPGDRVDVLVTIDQHTSSSNPVTNTLLQNIEVLAAGQKTSQKDGAPMSVQSVTLLVDPQGAEKVAHASHEGEIHLVLRNPDDLAEVKVDQYSTGEMLGYAPKAPAVRRSSPAPAPVVVKARDPGKIRIIRSSDVTEQPALNDSTAH
jgi:pilus assembly protein CpaB